MAENVGGIEYTIDANTDPLLKANKSVDTSLDSVQKSFTAASTSADNFDKSIKKTADEVKKANGWYEDANGRLRGLKGRFVSAKEQADAFGTGVSGAGAKTKKFNVNLTAVATGVKKANDLLIKGAKYVAGLTAAFTAVAKIASSAGIEIQKMAALSNTSVETFQELSFGAGKLGVSGEKLGDIFKDVQDKIGDFISTGGGELADYFTNVAPLVGQTAEEFANLSGPDALIKFKEGLDEANISASQQIFYLESLANDTSLLTPLLANNAQGFKDAAKEARELNLVLSKAEVEELTNVNEEFNRLLVTIAKMAQKIVAENGPEIRQAIQAITEVLVNGTKAAKNFFGALSGGTEIEKLEKKISGAYDELLKFRTLTQEEYLIKVATTDFGELKKQRDDLSGEYERLQKDSVTIEFKEKHGQELIDRIQSIDLMLEKLKDNTKDEYEVYVDAKTGEAEQKLRVLSDKLTKLRKGESADSGSDDSDAEVKIPTLVPTDQPVSIFDTKAFGSESYTKDDFSNISSSGNIGDQGVSKMNLDLQEGLGITQQMADQIETLDQKFQNVGSTIADTLVGAALSFSDTLGNGIVNGIREGENLNDTLKSIGQTVVSQVLASFISLGAQYLINAALKSSADAEMAASGVASTTAVTAASAASAATLAAAWAPAAAGATIATAGGAAAAGTAALSTTYATSNALALAGGRLNGGGVAAGNAYQVTENGEPEMLTVGGKNILMMGNKSGTVTSNSDLQSSGAGGAVYVNVTNNSSNSQATATQSLKDGKTIVDVVVADLNSNGKISKAITNNTTANYKAR